jgi:iron complex transport system substrate-binding protein
MERFVLILVFVALSLSAFANTIEDLVGRKVPIPKTPKRIVCLSPGTLRLITYLKAQELVVGIEELEVKNNRGRPYWLAHQELSKLPVIAPGGPAGINKIPDLERILRIRPDLIFVTLLDKSKADMFQKRIGVPVVVLSYGLFASFDKIVFQSLHLAGKILEKSKRAVEIESFVEETRKDLLRRSQKSGRRETAYIGGIGFKGGHGIESTNSAYIPFEWLGVDNLAKGLGKRGHLFVNKEKILAKDPPFIFIDGGGLALVRADFQRKPRIYQGLRAFREKKVFTLFPFNWYTTNIGTVIIDSYAIGKKLFPKEFQDISLRDKAREVYRFFVGKDVYAQMVKDYGRLGDNFFTVKK